MADPCDPPVIHYIEELSAHEDGKSIEGLEGATMWLSAITEEEEVLLTEHFKTMKWNGKLKRKVHDWYYDYDERRGRVVETEVYPPSVVEAVIERVIQMCVPDFHPDAPIQVRVNAYEQREGIGAHVDSPLAFGDWIISVSMGVCRPMRFTRDDETVKVQLPIRSAIMLTGPSRFEWKHTIRNIKRRVRYSLTIRPVRP